MKPILFGFTPLQNTTTELAGRKGTTLMPKRKATHCGWPFNFQLPIMLAMPLVPKLLLGTALPQEASLPNQDAKLEL